MKQITKVLKFAAALTIIGTAAWSEKIVLISHAPDDDSWWSTIQNAVVQSAQDFSIDVEYKNPANGDLKVMAALIRAATGEGVDGIVTTIADFEVLGDAIKGAVDAGIPVITINSGTKRQSRVLGALMHIGQPEYDAGFAAGVEASERGATNFICVNHYISNPASVDRCQGFADAMGLDLGDAMIDSGTKPADVKAKVLEALNARTDVDAILTLGPTSAHPTLQALAELEPSRNLIFGTFDFSSEIAEGIDAEIIDFAIDQQPYLQGYLPVMILTHYVRYGLLPANSINSGPGFIRKDNMELAKKHAGLFR